MAFLKYLSLHSSVWDFGINMQVTSDLFRRGMVSRMFDGHAIFFMPIYGLLTLFGSAGPYLFILIQTSAILGGVYLLFNSLPENQRQIKWGIVTLLYTPIWFNIFFDIRWEHLYVLLCGLFYLLAGKRGRKSQIGILILGVLACMVKEPFAFGVFFMGIYLLLKRRKELAGTAIFLMIFSTVYFLFIQKWAIPYFVSAGAADIWAKAYGYLGSDFQEVVISLMKQPWLIITEPAMDMKKLAYLVILFGPFCFLSLLGPLELIPAVPLLMISLLSREPGHYAYANQYTAGLIVPIIAGFMVGLQRLEAFLPKVWFKRAVFGILFSSVLFHVWFSPSPISRLFLVNKLWLYDWRAYAPTERTNHIQKAILKHIPQDPDVIVTTQNTLNTYRLLNRNHFFSFPIGVTEPGRLHERQENLISGFMKFVTGSGPPISYKPAYADYVVLDLKRSLFLNYRGCHWYFDHCRDLELAKEFLVVFEETLRSSKIVYEYDGFFILRFQPG